MAGQARFMFICGATGKLMPRHNPNLTPFGEMTRKLRAQRGVTIAAMAEAVGVTAGHLSGLEHGKKGRPSWPLVQKIIHYFELIWDEAEALEQAANLSDPRVTVDTSDASSLATRMANRLAREINDLDEAQLAQIESVLDQPKSHPKSKG